MNEIIEALRPFAVPIWIVAYVVIGLLARWIILGVISRSVEGIVSGVKRKRGVNETQQLKVSPIAAVRTVQRARTIGSVLSNFVTVVIAIVVIVLILGKAAPDVLTSLSLLSAALGAGLGFGAQRIVGDVLNGVFMVMEDQLGVGDSVDIGGTSGVVESVGVRITQLRDVQGTLWFIRNGDVQKVGNNSQGWNRAIIDLAVPYGIDRRRVEELMLRESLALAREREWFDRFIEDPTLWGVESISAEAIVLRLVAKVRPDQRSDVERALRARLQDALKAEGIELPALNTIVVDAKGAVTVQPVTSYAERSRLQQESGDAS